jgi:hypothetical protein
MARTSRDCAQRSYGIRVARVVCSDVCSYTWQNVVTALRSCIALFFFVVQGFLFFDNRVLTTVTCSLVEVYSAYSSTLKMGTTHSSEILVHFYHNARRQIPRDITYLLI